MTRAFEVLKFAFLMSVNFVGAFGMFLIVYAFLHEADPQRYSLGVVDDTALLVSQGLALIGVLVTACSIFFPLHTRKPHPISYPIAILVSLLVLYALKQLVLGPGHLPDLAINGYAILGLSAAIFRLLPYTFHLHQPQIEQGNG